MSLHRSLLLAVLSVSLTASPALAAKAGAPAPAAKASAPVPLKTTQTVAGPVSELTLPNGLHVILKENHAAPVVTWDVIYKVGSRDEPAGATGSAHLLEHMLFKGTKTLGKGQVAQLLERNGADSNAGTWVDWTHYYETYSSDRLEMGLMVEAARMRDALILDAERQSEMTVVRNELERGESNPSRILYQHLMSTAFRSHPYHHPTIGWRADVEGVPTSQLKRFYDTYYQPNNAVAVLVGDFKTADAVAMIRRYFDAIPKGATPPAVRTVEEPQTGERRFKLARRGETNLVTMGYHIPAASHADMGPLLVLDAILSTGVTGRMYQALVEPDIATSASTDVGLMRDPGLFRVSASLKPGADHAKVETALIAELEKLVQAPVTTAELTKAKAQAEAAYVYESEGTSGLAEALASFAAIDRWERNFSLLADIKHTSASDIQRVAKLYFTPENRTVGWYVATPDGPVPASAQVTPGQATANEVKVVPLALQAFEKRKPAPRKLTAPVRRVLANGLTVVVLENPSSQTVSLDGQLWVGSLHEPKGRDGIASAVASMLDAGTTKRNKLKLAEDLERVSASVGASSGTSTTDVSGNCLAGDLDVMITALAETLMTPTFPEDELAKLKSRWIAGIRRGEDSPGTQVSRAFARAIYPVGHPYYRETVAEDIQDIEAITRQDLVDFHRRWYGPNATTIVIVGKVKASDVVAKLDQAFASWPKVAVEKRTAPTVARNAPTRVVIPMPDKSNVEVKIGHAGDVLRSSPDYFAAQLGNYVLGGDSLTGRLGLRLRDELGLTYGTNSGLSAGLSAGTFGANLTVNPANLDRGVRELRTVITAYLQGGISARELATAKSAYIGSQAVGLASNSGMAGSLAGIELYGLGLDYWGRYPALIDAVTVPQVNAAIRAHIHPEAAHTILVGPLTP